MTLECWYYVAGIVTAVVGILGLLGLVVYAVDTRKLRMAAQIRDMLNHGKVIICEFESLSGTRYETTSSIPDDTRQFDIQHRFKPVS